MIIVVNTSKNVTNVNFESIMMPRYLTSSTSSIALLLIRIVTWLFVLFLAWKIKQFVLVIFKESLFIT